MRGRALDYRSRPWGTTHGIDVPGPANRSLWLATSPSTDYPRLMGEVEVDVAVIGGGITGITAASLLKQEGKTVALVEAKRIVHGISGYTTAKLTVCHGLVYARLLKRVGQDGARLYAESNQQAVERIDRFVQEHQIDCDFERAANVVYSERAQDAQKIRDEVDAARRAGVDASLTTETELPCAIAAAIEVPGQAQFHPRRYLLSLADQLPGAGSHVFEQTRAHDVHEHARGCLVETSSGTVRAQHIVIATHLPFVDRGLFFAKAHPAASYAIAGPCDAERAPRAMYISADQPVRSIRSTPRDSDTRTLIVGGEGHKPGTDADTRRRYQALEAFLNERLSAVPVEHRWSAHDYQPIDGLPYIGTLTRRTNRIYVATGFAKWGLTKGTLAAMLITDLIIGRQNRWAELYDSQRLHPAASKTFLIENGHVARHFVGGRLKRRDGPDALDRLEPGQGAIARIDRRRVAAYRDPDGVLHTLSATCTHLGCSVEWNTAERTWDCPCHGSRYAATGENIEGPAGEPLSRVSLPRP